MFFSEKIKSIKKNDKVLEIGPGSSPFYRSDILLEKRFEKKEAFEQRARQPKVKYDKPIYYYDGEKFPFKDNRFDYVICSQVIEHVAPQKLSPFIKEIERVAKKGYIELPRLFYEYLFNFKVHKWMADYRNNKLILLPKDKVDFTHIQDVYYLLLKHGVKNKKFSLIKNYIGFFMIGFEWKNRINYKVVDKLEELLSEKDVSYYADYFQNLGQSDEFEQNRVSFFDKIKKKVNLRN